MPKRDASSSNARAISPRAIAKPSRPNSTRWKKMPSSTSVC